MKKTLLLAAALACSGVVQAEIYLCKSEANADVEWLGANNSGQDDVELIVNTDQGFRYRDSDKGYGGDCATGGRFVVCEELEADEDGQYGEGKLVIDTLYDGSDFGEGPIEDLRFTYHWVIYGQAVLSYAGNCTQI